MVLKVVYCNVVLELCYVNHPLHMDIWEILMAGPYRIYIPHFLITFDWKTTGPGRATRHRIFRLSFPGKKP